MRTVTYNIRHWTHEETGAGDCFEVIEQETRHTVTGDECESFGIASFGTIEEARQFIETILKDDADDFNYVGSHHHY